MSLRDSPDIMLLVIVFIFFLQYVPYIFLRFTIWVSFSYKCHVVSSCLADIGLTPSLEARALQLKVTSTSYPQSVYKRTARVNNYNCWVFTHQSIVRTATESMNLHWICSIAWYRYNFIYFTVAESINLCLTLTYWPMIVKVEGI